jgi:N-formylglutamate amidohydrolase
MKMLLCFLALWSVAASAADLVPGRPLISVNKFTEFIPGDLPLVIAAPHGGRETPAEVPDRTQGVLIPDANTMELARAIAAEVHKKTGRNMHLVMAHLHRKKLDPNRDLPEAAEGNLIATQSWKDYHGFIEQACDAAVKRHGIAFFIDLHGQNHPDVRVELGYLHSAAALAASDEEIDKPAFAARGSLQLIAGRSKDSYSQLLRGPSSLGALLEKHGFPSTPSPRMPAPTEPFFSGGYSVERHCDAKKNVTGLQIETNRPNLRDTKENRQRFAEALVAALQEYLPARLGVRLDGQSSSSGQSR